MAKTPSTMAALGTVAPPFSLLDTGSRVVSLSDFADAPALLVMFICNHCPYVVHLREAIAKLTAEYAVKGVAAVAISTNDVESYPQDGPAEMKREKADAGYVFPYLYDESQAVSKAYRAACTPDFFVYGADRKLFYRGRFDGSRPGNDVAITGEDLRQALDALLSGADAPQPQLPSLGCNIKWKPGNEPDYYG